MPMILAVLFIPFVVWQQSFEFDRIQETYQKLTSGNAETIAQVVRAIALLLIIVQFLFVLVKYHLSKVGNTVQYSTAEVKAFFLTHFGTYTIFSLLITGAIISPYRIEQYLYLVNYAIIVIAIPKLNPVFEPREIRKNVWLRNFLILLVFIALLALIAINTHGEMSGMHKRFEF